MPRKGCGTRMVIGAVLIIPMLIPGMRTPGWAQSAIVPTSPDDPASKSLGWVEAAPALDRASLAGVSPPEPADYAAAFRPTRRHTTRLRRVRRQTQHSRARGMGDDNLANYLNRQELARIEANGVPLQQRAQSYRR